VGCAFMRLVSRALRALGLCFAIDSSFLPVHVSCRDHPDQCPVGSQCKGDVQPSAVISLPQRMEAGFVGAVPRIRDNAEGGIKEDLFRLRLAHLVLVAALARIARVPIESNNAGPIHHRCILPSYTSLGSMAQRAVGDGRHNPQALAPGARLSEPLGGDLAQCLSSPGGINAKGKQLPRHLLSRPGALDWDLWIKTERDQIFPTVESIAVAPVSAARGRNEKMEAAAKGHLARIANEDAPGMSAVDGRVGAGN